MNPQTPAPPSETPRTDAATYDIVVVGDAYTEKENYPDGSGNYVSVDHARILERELTAALARIAGLEKSAGYFKNLWLSDEAENDKLLTDAGIPDWDETLGEYGALCESQRIKMLMEQRDAAVEALTWIATYPQTTVTSLRERARAAIAATKPKP